MTLVAEACSVCSDSQKQQDQEGRRSGGPMGPLLNALTRVRVLVTHRECVLGVESGSGTHTLILYIRWSTCMDDLTGPIHTDTAVYCGVACTVGTKHERTESRTVAPRRHRTTASRLALRRTSLSRSQVSYACDPSERWQMPATVFRSPNMRDPVESEPESESGAGATATTPGTGADPGPQKRPSRRGRTPTYILYTVTVGGGATPTATGEGTDGGRLRLSTNPYPSEPHLAGVTYDQQHTTSSIIMPPHARWRMHVVLVEDCLELDVTFDSSIAYYFL